VGHRNYRHFLLFLFYLLAGCAFILGTASLTRLSDPGTRHFRRYSFLGPIPIEAGPAALFQLILVFSASIALSLFALWHVYLTCTGQTTLEFYINAADRREARRDGIQWHNPFHRGLQANWDDVMLAKPCTLSQFLPSTREPRLDGMNWPGLMHAYDGTMPMHEHHLTHLQHRSSQMASGSAQRV